MTDTVQHTELIEMIERHAARHGVSVSSIGRAAINDPNLYRDLKDGRELRRATESLVRKYLDDATGEGAAA